MARLLALLVALAALCGAGAAQAQDRLVADLSKHLVAITTGFAGTDVLLFGATEGEGDVIVVVRGPTHTETVRRKERNTGIWVNSGAAEIHNAPALYMVAASRPLEEFLPTAVAERHQIGIEHLNLDVESPDRTVPAEEYRKALIRLKQNRRLYCAEPGRVTFMGNRLFRTELHFPANVPTGTYSVEVYLVDKGEVVSAQTTPLIISKVGVGADVYDFAHRQAAIYGIIAIVVAVTAGWAAAAAFKKG